MKKGSKYNVLAFLEDNKDSFVSGGSMAQQLGISRNSVWKAIKSLEDEGYEIESITGKGYRLLGTCSILSEQSIQHYLQNSIVDLHFLRTTDSTNTQAKMLADKGAREGTLVVADEQTAGRGRQGRPFYSPAGTGVYFSLLLRPTFSTSDISLITSYAAVCVARALEEIFGVEAKIKWVNDIFVNNRKVCGILTEASFDAETGSVQYVVVGIGINVMTPEGGFPGSVPTVASSVMGDRMDVSDYRARLVARVTDLFMEGYPTIPQRPHLAEYQKRSLLDGRLVQVHIGKQKFMAKVLGVGNDFTLKVRLADGETRRLNQGEVHIPSSQL